MLASLIGCETGGMLLARAMETIGVRERKDLMMEIMIERRRERERRR